MMGCRFNHQLAVKGRKGTERERTLSAKATHDTDRQSVKRLQSIINVGPSIASDFGRIGITTPQELIGRDPLILYKAICRKDKAFHDPCVLDVVMSCVDYMNGGKPRKWWEFTEIRKEKYTDDVDELRRQFG